MRQISPIFARFIEVLPTAILLTIGETIYTLLHAALHLGVPRYWITLPITWPTILIVDNFSADYIPEAFLEVFIFFAMLLNTMILILLVKSFWRWVRR